MWAAVAGEYASISRTEGSTSSASTRRPERSPAARSAAFETPACSARARSMLLTVLSTRSSCSGRTSRCCALGAVGRRLLRRFERITTRMGASSRRRSIRTARMIRLSGSIASGTAREAGCRDSSVSACATANSQHRGSTGFRSPDMSYGHCFDGTGWRLSRTLGDGPSYVAVIDKM
jgi:hypothetical protein